MCLIIIIVTSHFGCQCGISSQFIAGHDKLNTNYFLFTYICLYIVLITTHKCINYAIILVYADIVLYTTVDVFIYQREINVNCLFHCRGDNQSDLYR